MRNLGKYIYLGRPLPRYSWAPEGFVLQQKGRPNIPIKATYSFADRASCDSIIVNKRSSEAMPDIIPQIKNETNEDWPDLPYRGFMLDVVRDFRTVDEVLQILDLMASWKLNTLHL